VLAYAGWSDAGDAATCAARQLMEQLSASRYATIDTEDFLDFTVVRPHARQAEDGRREIVWPDHEFFAAKLADSDLLVGLGVEPHLRWKSYTHAVVELCRHAGVAKVVMLGAYLADVIYSQPTQVGAFSGDPELAEQLQLGPSGYEGPTGILGVLGAELGRAGIPSLSLWARIPHYVSTRPHWRGALALLQEIQQLTELRVELSGVEEQAGTFDQEVSELISADPQLSAYVRELKRRAFSQ